MIRLVLILQIILFFKTCNYSPICEYDTKRFVGKYGLFEPYDSSYSEIYIREDSIDIFSMNFGSEGPFKYSIKKDTISFANYKYKIEVLNQGLIRLQNNSITFRLHRFQDDKLLDTEDGISPVHLRRCYVLVHEGIISMKEAIDYLEKVKPLSREEDFTHINELMKKERSKSE